MKKLFSLIISIVLLLSLCSCGAGEVAEESTNNKLKIVATIFPQYDFARAIAGDKAQVKMLITPGTESHSFEPTTSDIKAIQNCDIFIYTGGESDHWIDSLLENIENKDIKILSLMDIIDPHSHEEEAEHEHSHQNHSHVDEHVWTSPKNAVEITTAICDEMCLSDPENSQFYKDNLSAYTNKLTTLHKDFADTVSTAKRNTLVFGDRFPLTHFSKEYGLEYFAAFSGCSEDTEPSASVVADLIRKTKAEDIPVVFKIELSSDSIASTIAKETGAKVLTFYSCHNISKEDFKNGETYITLMQKNVESLKTALN